MAALKRIVFLETEPDEQESLTRELAPHIVTFATSTDEIAEVEILSVFVETRVDRALLDRCPALRLVATRSTAAEHIDVAECARRGIRVCNVPSYGEHTVAEHTFALMLGVARRLREAMHLAQHASFSYEDVRATELHGKTLGVIGAGKIGQHVIRFAKGFDMRVVVHELDENPELAQQLGFVYVSFDELLAEAEIITLHAPLTPANYHLFDRETFAKCRRGVLIINTARGRLIDTDALCEALDSGVVGGAALDVLEDERVLRRDTPQIIGEQIVEHLHGNFRPRELRAPDNARVQELEALMQNHRLLVRPNVLFTPHMAFNSVEAVERILQTTIENIRAFVAGVPVNVVSPEEAARG
jgi:D-lactate dehydrogenase